MDKEPETWVSEILGQPAKYWLELQRRFESQAGPSASDLMREIMQLRGKLSFYESRIKQMHDLSNGNY